MSHELARVLGELYGRIPLGMRLGLEAMNDACARAGYPERAYECVHVAGTNGKGSVCAMVESVARAAGMKTGMYTSPHLLKLSERIQVNGVAIGDDALEDVLGRALAIGPELSFFEAVTLAAFLAFRDAKVEIAIVEVGIGGRLDATNVIPPPRAAAITRIAFDHMDKLGETLVEIAREKAAIAKPGVTVVLGEMTSEVRVAIDEVVYAREGRTVDVAELGPPIEGIALHLAGAHQLGNRDVAVGLCRVLGLDEGAIARGLAAARWPGRLERIDGADGAYLLDGAHNPDGARALAEHLGSLGDSPLALVFGALADKAWPAMLDLLAPMTTHRVYAQPRGRAATPLEELAARHAGSVAGSVTLALQQARALVGPGGVVVVCGSLYLVGEARAVLLGLESDPPVAM